jgi:hypothetical protein
MRAPLTSVLLTLNDVHMLRLALRTAVDDGSIHAGAIEADEIKAIDVKVARVDGKLARAERRLKRKIRNGS